MPHNVGLCVRPARSNGVHYDKTTPYIVTTVDGDHGGVVCAQFMQYVVMSVYGRHVHTCSPCKCMRVGQIIMASPALYQQTVSIDKLEMGKSQKIAAISMETHPTADVWR